MTNFKRNPATMPDGAIIRPHVDPPDIEIGDPDLSGCAFATTAHPRWDNSGSDYIYGSDWYGFGIVPSGKRGYEGGPFVFLGSYAHLWSTTQTGSYNAWPRLIYWNSGIIRKWSQNRNDGGSVRCVRDLSESEESDPQGTIYANDYTDGSSNTYSGVKIGNQIWTKKNLITTKYQNSDDITTGLSGAQWKDTTSGAYAIYPHADVDGIASEQAMIDAYGILYNWHAVNNGLVTGSYRVPSDSDLTALTDYLISQYDVTKDNVAMILKSCRQVNHPLA